MGLQRNRGGETFKITSGTRDGMKQIFFFIESGLIEVHLGFLTLIVAASLAT
jgi:hypothetical protein